MYTLQILDAGQTFLHALGEQPVSLGSAERAQVRLTESGVEPQHARFEPSADGVRLVALAKVRVNGKTVEQAQLQLGDRIEIGRAVLVVGRTVARAASPDDVLAGSVRRAPRRPRGSSSKLVPIAAAAIVAGLAIMFALQGDDRGQVGDQLAYVETLRAKGHLDDARQVVERLRREWANAEDDRLARLDVTEAAIIKVDTTKATLLQQLLDPADPRNYAEWTKELDRLEHEGAPDQRVAARQLRSRLRATLRQRDERVRELAIARHRSGATAPQTAASAGSATAAPAGASAAPTRTGAGVSPTIQTAEVDRFCAEGMYAQAMALVQAGFEQAADAGAVSVWRASERSVREQATKALAELLSEARSAAEDDRLQHAVALLQSGRHRFPASAEFRQLGVELTRFQAKAEARALAAERASSAPRAQPAKVDESTRLATLASLRSHMDAVRSAEERGAFADAGRLLREASAAVRARDADFAERLLVRADEAELLAAWHEAVVAAVNAGKPLTTSDVGGAEVELRGVDGHHIICRSADGDAQLSWHEVDAAGVQSLVRQVRAKGRPALGAAALLYKQGETESAEAVLLEVLRGDASLQSDVERVIARGRGEDPGDLGYTLQKGVFVSRRLIQVEKRAGQLAKGLESAMRAKEASARDAFVAETLAVGGIESEALATAMRSQMESLQRRLDNASVKKQVGRLVAERKKLDAARKHAKDLIFDEVRYFYPYKPPAVSGEKHAEYNRVQAEVNERVAALRDFWQGSRIKVRVPARLGENLGRLTWLAQQLTRLGGFGPGESAADVLDDLAWARALPAGESVGLQQFSLTVAERRARERWQQVLAYNVALGKRVSVAQREQMRITNEYRMMFGHRPLAAAMTCTAAAQGHADEMSRLGYFSHTSPTPGLRTPYDRMRKAGYMFGVSENIATTGGALSAHNAWCRSSGHHRNLLAPGHREVGIGANGRYWVQNFGSGEVHLSDPAWVAQKTR